jgi:hypothetical protein
MSNRPHLPQAIFTKNENEFSQNTETKNDSEITTGLAETKQIVVFTSKWPHDY